MTVQCPNCGHSGTLPSNMESGQHKIRCRRCGVRFETQPKAAEQKVDAEPEIDSKGLSELATEMGIEPEFQSEEVDSAIGLGDLKIDVSAEMGSLADPPPYPWFYGFLEAWGVLYLVAAVLALLAMVLVLAGILVGASPVSDSPVSYVVAAIPFVVVAFVLVTCAAVLFLIVDLARNIRLTRFRAERAELLLRTNFRNRG
jgi:transcription elongation factor Elf1